MNERDRLKYLVRVRDLRTQLASGELYRRRRAQSRAETAVTNARNRKAAHEQQSAHAGAWGDEFAAAEAHHLMSYVSAARLQLKDDVTLIRRAELTLDRARETASEALADYQRAHVKHAASLARWKSAHQSHQRAGFEREDETLAESQQHLWKTSP